MVDNYLDDIWFLADSAAKNSLQMLIAEFWARWLGIELNAGKREPPRTSTRHLGFQIDLRDKLVSITKKQKDKILGYFDQFLMCVRKMGRIATKTLQRMLGL